VKLRSAPLRWICAGLLCSGVARPQPPAVIKSETKLVVVDVVVTDKKGAYVHDLTAKDFHLWDDNKEQTIQSFALESAASANTAGAASQTDYMVVAFDYAGMDAGDQIRARQAAARFIDANAGPDRRMAVANIDAGLRIAQGFTDNPGRLKDAVSGAKSTVVAVNNTRAGASASSDLGSRDRFQALTSLAADLKAAPGRKTIVLLTGNLVAGSDQKGALADAIQACNRANVAVYPVDVRDVSLPGNFDASNAGGRGGRGGGGGAGGVSGGGRGGRGGGAGGADPEVRADPTGASQQVLFALASGTGGFVIRNASEWPSGLQKGGQEQAEYYVLGFTPADSKAGACHALKVKLDRPGTTLRARSSYCSGKPEELAGGNVTENDLAKRAAAAQGGNLAASMRLPFFYLAAGVARVDVVMELQPDAIQFEKKKDSLHAEVNVLGIATPLAEGAGGDVAARFSDTLTLDFPETDQHWKEKPVHYEKEFKIAPGQYTLTVVFSTGGESFGKLAQPIAIEPYQPGQFALSGLAIGKQIRRPAAGETVATASLFDDRTPLSINGVELIPTGAASFSPSEQAFCYFEIYSPEAGDASSVRLRVLNAKTGEQAWDGGVSKVQFPPGKSTIPVGVSVPIATLAPGSYQLEATVTDGAGKTARRTAAFDIK
jgi:VWFA-related protein